MNDPPKSDQHTTTQDGSKRRNVIGTAIKLAWIVPAVIATIELSNVNGQIFPKPTVSPKSPPPPP